MLQKSRLEPFLASSAVKVVVIRVMIKIMNSSKNNDKDQLHRNIDRNQNNILIFLKRFKLVYIRHGTRRLSVQSLVESYQRF